LLAEADLGDGVPEGDTVLVGIYKLERIVRASWRKEVIARDVRRPSARAKKKAKRKARR
jgi:hypothetical protein